MIDTFAHDHEFWWVFMWAFVGGFVGSWLTQKIIDRRNKKKNNGQ